MTFHMTNLDVIENAKYTFIVSCFSSLHCPTHGSYELKDTTRAKGECITEHICS